MSKKRVFISAKLGLLTPTQHAILTTFNHIDAPYVYETLTRALQWSFEYPQDLCERDKAAQALLMSLLINTNKLQNESPVQTLSDN